MFLGILEYILSHVALTTHSTSNLIYCLTYPFIIVEWIWFSYPDSNNNKWLVACFLHRMGTPHQRCLGYRN